jgi:hypothetical protein
MKTTFFSIFLLFSRVVYDYLSAALCVCMMTCFFSVYHSLWYLFLFLFRFFSCFRDTPPSLLPLPTIWLSVIVYKKIDPLRGKRAYRKEGKKKKEVGVGLKGAARHVFVDTQFSSLF